MRWKRFFLYFFGWGSLVMGFLTSCHPIFAKEQFFSPSPFILAKISPNGEKIAYVGADKNGISNVFVMTKEKENLSQNTFYTTPEIIQFFWSADSEQILLLKEEDGKGGLQLHGVELESKTLTVYTEEFAQVHAKIFKVSPTKNCAVIGLNHRNAHFHDLYLLDLETSKLTLLLQNDTYAKFLISDELEPILSMQITQDGSWLIFHQEKPWMQVSAQDIFHTEFLLYDEKQKGVYLLDNRFSNTTQLTFKPLHGPEKVLGGQEDSDIDEVLFIDNKPKAYATYYEKKKWHVIDPLLGEDFTFLKGKIGEGFEIVSQNRAEDVWVVACSSPEEGKKSFLYDRGQKSLSTLYATKGNFAKMYPLVVEARDGQKLVCYYTLPKELDKGGFVDKPLPLVVMPHGGPFKVRDKLEFNPYHQWLSSCGYAVLSVNFRLSSGFGKQFVNAGNGQWGKKAHLDVIDAVEACLARGIARREALAIFGGSYGGYETLAALTFTPNYFACCIAVCGPSNLKTVLDGVPKFWEFTPNPLADRMMFFTKSAFITSMGGDPETEQGRKYLESCSPLNFLSQIQAPLLLIHGKNDHIVLERESYQIYQKMKEANKQVAYLLFPDEGHRIAKLANKMKYLEEAEKFLSKYLEGSYQPVDPKLLQKTSGELFQ